MLIQPSLLSARHHPYERPSMLSRWLHHCRVAVVATAFVFALSLGCGGLVLAASSSAPLTGIVMNNGKAASGITVTVSGNEQVLRTTTDANGRFSFASLSLGTYRVQAGSNGLQGALD